MSCTLSALARRSVNSTFATEVTMKPLAFVPMVIGVVGGIAWLYGCWVGLSMSRRGAALSHLRSRFIGGLLAGVFFVNLIVGMWLQYAFLGGIAPNGRVDATGFYVGDHGMYHEVTPATYWFSFCYTLVSAVAFALTMAGTICLIVWGRSREASLSHGNAGEHPDRQLSSDPAPCASSDEVSS